MKILETQMDAGSKKNNPQMIVIHSMGENIDTRKEVLMKPKDRKIWFAPSWLRYLNLSVHALFMPNGDILKCREDLQGAWHAKGFNKNTLGFEFLVEGVHTYSTFRKRIKEDYVTPEQWEAGVEYVRSKMKLYDIRNIQRHSDLSPDRKVDPGSGFDWDKFKQEVGA